MPQLPARACRWAPSPARNAIPWSTAPNLSHRPRRQSARSQGRLWTGSRDVEPLPAAASARFKAGRVGARSRPRAGDDAGRQGRSGRPSRPSNHPKTGTRWLPSPFCWPRARDCCWRSSSSSSCSAFCGSLRCMRDCSAGAMGWGSRYRSSSTRWATTSTSSAVGCRRRCRYFFPAWAPT